MILLLAGCEGLHLYDAQNDVAAKSARESYTAIDLSTASARERENLQTQLEREVNASRDLMLATRDLRLMNLIDGSGENSNGPPLNQELFDFQTKEPASYTASRLVELGITNSALFDPTAQTRKNGDAFPSSNLRSLARLIRSGDLESGMSDTTSDRLELLRKNFEFHAGAAAPSCLRLLLDADRQELRQWIPDGVEETEAKRATTALQNIKLICENHSLDDIRKHFMRLTNVAAPSCASLLADPVSQDLTQWIPDGVEKTKAEEAKATLNITRRLCTENTQRSIFAKLSPRGEIVQAFREYTKANKELELVVSKTEAKKLEIADKKGEIDELDLGDPVDPAEKEAELQSKADDIQGILTDLRKIGQFSLKGRFEAVDEQLSAIECVISAAAKKNTKAQDAAGGASSSNDSASAGAQGGPAGQDKEKDLCAGQEKTSVKAAAVIAGTAPALIGDLLALASLDLEPPVLVRLQIEHQRLSLEHKYLKDITRLAEARVEARRDKLSALVDEAALFNKVYLERKLYEDDEEADMGLSVACVLDPEACKLGQSEKPKDVARNAVARAVAAYASATGESRARQFEADYRYIQTLHLQALRADEYAIAEWDSLIRPALTQLAAYHESGVKTETIVSIFQGLANIGLLSVLVAKD